MAHSRGAGCTACCSEQVSGRATRPRSAYSFITTVRLSLSDGVSWPPSSVKSHRQDHELADRLGLADRLVGVVDGRLHRSEQVRVLGEIGHRGVQPACRGPSAERRDRIRVEVTRQAMNGFASPTTMHWLISGVGAQPVLQHRGRDVLAAGRDDELLLAAGDRQEAVGVELTDVAGVEEAVLVDAPLWWPSRCASSRAGCCAPRSSTSPSSAILTVRAGDRAARPCRPGSRAAG